MNAALANAAWLFFDLGSTLLDESAAVAKRVADTVRQLRGTPWECTEEAFYARMAQAAQHHAHPYALTMELLGSTAWAPWPKDLTVPYPAARPLLAALHRRHRLGIIANQHAGTQQRLEAWGLAPFFDVVVSSAEAGVKKPDPRIFQLALAQAGCTPQQAVMLGDRLDNDIAPAKALGMHTVWVRQGWGGKAAPADEAHCPSAAAEDLPALAALFGLPEEALPCHPPAPPHKTVTENV